MKSLLMVASGGALGAVARYLLAAQALRLMGPNFPWGTLSVNILGSFLMGALTGLLALRYSITPEFRLFLVVGALGGFTTFSAFSLDVSVMLERNDMVSAAGYVIASVVLSVLALFIGLWAVRAVYT